MGLGKSQRRKPSCRRGGSSRASQRSAAVTLSLRRQAEAKGMQAEPEETDGPRIKVSWARAGVMITGEYGICVARMPAVKNWAEYDGKQLRQVVAELKLVINGHVEVTMAHARLPEDFGSAVAAGAPGQIFCERFGGCVMTVHPGVQDHDVDRFKDFLGGDTTVKGRKEVYEEGERRRPHQLSSLCSPNKIRVHADAANLNHNNDTCAVVFCFQLEPGANVTLCSMEYSFYC
ncbi:uncharacterized protein BBA_02890 [Beauveria bassiana ARSEF 2860]|uniref:Uncharacterized protein n=1 Tax=Beauveria bassiana (strain ARSEF 2860) TaxID=655819 RepID=J4KPT1_BEAB2|nr:uncharacterized protein BBA_02890 [Beauveria bassiana ARSEF 2860]EJP67994.1 hypothetical protein BBA_02890 [Beauveria bassiana ARSEF 2860]